MIRIFILLCLALPLVHAERIIAPGNMFRDPQFLKSFVGSYGILSDVEPHGGGGFRSCRART